MTGMAEPDRKGRELIRRVREHPVVTVLLVLTAPIGSLLKKAILVTDWVSRYDTWSLHTTGTPDWLGEFLRLLAPNLPLMGYAASIGLLTFLYFGGARQNHPPHGKTPGPVPSRRRRLSAAERLQKSLDFEREERAERVRNSRRMAAPPIVEADQEPSSSQRAPQLYNTLTLASSAPHNPMPALEPPPHSKEEPDIILELAASRRHTRDSLESVEIVAYNDNHAATAMDVEIATLSSGNYQSGFWTGDAATPAGPVMVNTTIRFEPIPHIESKRRVSAEPINPALSMQERMVKESRQGDAPGLWWFVDAARRHRELAELQQVIESQQRTTSERLRHAPIDIPMRVTYRNAQQTRRWQRLERLHYDPGTLTAYIAHGERRELSDDRPQPHQPIANVKTWCVSGRAELIIRNDGPSANFWGTLRIVGEVENLWDRANLFCRWSDTASVRTLITKGQERRIVLAAKNHELSPQHDEQTSPWVIYGIAGDRLISVRGRYPAPDEDQEPARETADVVLEGSINADPDLANGVQTFRVILKSSQAVAE